MASQNTISDPLTMTLDPWGPPGIPGQYEGDGVTAGIVTFENDLVEFGVWEVTPSTFAAQKVGIGEVMHIISGRGELEHADGTVTVLEPNVIVSTPEGWTGTWRVLETIRKSYCIYKTV